MKKSSRPQMKEVSLPYTLFQVRSPYSLTLLDVNVRGFLRDKNP
jgi:hypothetical protein